MRSFDIIKILLAIPFIIAGGFLVIFMSYMLVPMMIATSIFAVIYIIYIDLKG